MTTGHSHIAGLRRSPEGTHSAQGLVAGSDGDDMLRNAFLRRATHAIEHMARSASLEALADALQAPTDFGAIATALGSTGIPRAALELDPLADALARGAAAREHLVARAGGLLSAAEAGRALGGISRQAIDKRRRANQILAVNVGADWRYPAAQITAAGTTPAALPDILRRGAQAGLIGWAMLDFLLAPDSALSGETPLHLIQGGRPDAVIRLLTASASDSFG